MHRLLLDYFGANTLAEQVTCAGCREFKSEIRYLPVQWKRLPRFRGQHIKNIIKEAKAEVVSNKISDIELPSNASLNRTLSQLKKLMTWAFEQELIPINPTLRLRGYPSHIKKVRRRPFEIAELYRWFAHSFLKTRKWSKEHFWISVILLYSGARLGEVAQLVCDDIKYVRNVPVISINDGDIGTMIRNLKSKNAVRNIPVHPELQKLNLFRFAEKSKANPHGRLFPSVTPDVLGAYSTIVSKRFNRQLRHLGIDNQVVVHSFRHGFQDAMREAEIPDDAAKSLGGWSRGSDTANLYGKGYSIASLYEFVERIEFPGLFIAGYQPFLEHLKHNR